jgi:hypothetical protein
MNRKEYNRGIGDLEAETFAKGSVEDFARTCIIESIRYEEARLDQGITTFEHYNAESPGNEKHLLSQLTQQFPDFV